MDVKMNSELINETVDDVVSTVNFLCKIRFFCSK